MEIKRDSQIYRFMSRWYLEPENCRTVCSLWTNLLLSSFILTILGTAIGMAIAGVFQIIAFLGFGINTYDITVFTNLSASLGFLAIFFGIFQAIRFIFNAIIYRWNPNKEPGLIKTTYHGLKDKYCPTITWVD